MSKVLLIGAAGQVSQHLLPMLANSDIETVAMVRDKTKLVTTEGIEIIEGDLETDFDFAFEGCDRVIFSAGSGAKTGFDKTLLVDLWAAKKAIDYAATRQIRQFVMVSSRGADNPDKGPITIKPYLVAKFFADEYLRASTVPYTILQPGRLIDEEGVGRVTTLRPEAAAEQIISRQDTARAVLQALQTPASINKTYELYVGETPIEQAIV